MEKTTVRFLDKKDIAPFPHTNWNATPWCGVQDLPLTYHMGPPPEHRPTTRVKLGYDEKALHLLFHVEDNYIRAKATQNQDAVCTDSCVEFFFTPAEDTISGYFNLEMNCGGTMLFHYHPRNQKAGIALPEAACRQIRIVHSLPKRIEQEICTPTTWFLACSLPFSLLRNYCNLAWPQAGTIWRANLYKCADHSSYPHWLTWSQVSSPRPNFHLPAFFGILEFR